MKAKRLLLTEEQIGEAVSLAWEGADSLQVVESVFPNAPRYIGVTQEGGELYAFNGEIVEVGNGYSITIDGLLVDSPKDPIFNEHKSPQNKFKPLIDI